LYPEKVEGESSNEASSRHVGGGGGGGISHISTMESSDEASSWLEGGRVVRQWLELPTSWREGGGAVWLEGEANLL
jgi:hypothetical protein